MQVVRPAGEPEDGLPRRRRDKYSYIRRCRDLSLKSECVVVCVNRIHFSSQLDFSNQLVN